jgi:hypothetical protein
MPIRKFNWDGQAGQLLDPGAAMAAGRTGTGTVGAAAAFSAVATILAKLNLISIQWRLKNELENIRPICDADIVSWADNNTTGKCYDPTNVGCIIHIIVAEDPAPLGMSSTYQFWAIFEGDIGLDPIGVVKNYLSNPSLRDGIAPVPSSLKEKWAILWYQYEPPTQGNASGT